MNCANIVTNHLRHLEDAFVCEALDESSAVVVTPYQLPDGDLIELNVEIGSNGKAVVSDLGETLAVLAVQGFDALASEKRKWLLERAVKLSEVTLDRGELRKEGDENEVGRLLLDVAAAARGVADLVYLHRSQEPQDFDSRVVEFVADHAVGVTPKAAVKGLSGHTYRVTAKVQRVEKPPLLVSALSPRGASQIKSSVDRTIRQWVDIDGTVDRNAKISFLNDLAVGWKESDILLLDRFSTVVTWRRRAVLEPVLAGEKDELERFDSLSLLEPFD